MSNYVKEIMRKAHIISDDKTFYDAIKQMIEEKTNSLVVVDKEGKLVGLLNTGMLIAEVVPDYLEEDAIAAHFANEDIFIEDVKKAQKSPIKKFMMKDPYYIQGEASLMELAVLALSNKQFRIPVVDKDKKPVGIITRTELKKVIGEILNIKDKE